MGADSGYDYPGCEAANPGTPADLHAGALMAMTGSCAFASCHNADGNRAMLVIAAGDNLNTTLVDKASCQHMSMPLVKSGGGNDALLGSWLWQKLAAPMDADYNVIAKPEWGAPNMGCQQMGGAPFGARMPATFGIELSASNLAKVRDWICAGAAGP